jgi:hypothetical protein
MTITRLAPSGLVDRQNECEVLDRLVAGVLAGQSRVLVIRGAAGVGKTALLEYLAGAAAGCRIARASGVESEMELAFAGLCAPMLGALSHLPGPQRDALSTAFGLSAGPPPDRFLVGLAVLSLLADVAEERPLICIVDDAQWLDQVSAQTLTFVARRLLAERVGLVFGLREPGDEQALAGLPELVIDGLDDPDAHLLLDSTLPGPLDERVRERILAEAGGNPLALLELPRGRTPAAVAGGFALPGVMPLTSRIEQGFVQKLRSLSVDTRRLLLLAAAEPVGDVPLLWRAAERLATGPDAAAPAQAAGLLEISARLRFRHPLVRSAVYRAAEARDRRQVHEALADATDPQLDPDRRAWHRAHAADGPDESVADDLDRSAGRARARGGVAAAAAFLERAAELTPAPARRGGRALAAARRSSSRQLRRPHSSCWRLLSYALSTSFSGPGSPACAPRSCSRSGAGATLRPCFSMPPDSSKCSIPRRRVRHTSRPSARPCTQDASTPNPACGRPPRRPAPRPRHRRRRDRSISFSTEWQGASRRDPAPARRL